MSHFTVMVIGPNPEEQLAPYHEYECTGVKDQYVVFVEPDESEEDLKKEFEENKESYDSFDEFMGDYYGYEKHEGKFGKWTNPNSKWDWYQLGGRWTGFFKLKDGECGQLGFPGLMTAPAENGYADQCLKHQIDIESMTEPAIKRAEEKYNLAHSVINEDDFITFDKMKELHDDIEEAKEKYRAQPVIKRWNAKGSIAEKLGFFASPEDFLMTREEYLTQAKNRVITTFAVLMDGKWYERGNMGWWVVVSNENHDYDEEFKKLFDSLPDDTLISIYDCHV